MDRQQARARVVGLNIFLFSVKAIQIKIQIKRVVDMDRQQTTAKVVNTDRQQTRARVVNTDRHQTRTRVVDMDMHQQTRARVVNTDRQQTRARAVDMDRHYTRTRAVDMDRHYIRTRAVYMDIHQTRITSLGYRNAHPLYKDIYIIDIGRQQTRAKSVELSSARQGSKDKLARVS